MLNLVARLAPQQAMVNPQRQLAANSRAGAREAIERVRDAAVRGVFHRHDAKLRLPPLDLLKHGRDRADRHQLGALAKALDRGEVAERELGAEVSDAGRCLDRPGGADHFAEDRANRIAGKRALVVRGQAVKHLRLPLGIEDASLLGLLCPADLAGNLGPPVDRGENLPVDGVELAAQVGDRLLRAGRSRVPARSSQFFSAWP